jgi:hypothetical protein
VNDGDQGNEFEEVELSIERDMLIQLHCKRGETVTVENDRVLCPFAKYYNKWYICVDTKKFAWNNELKNIRFLARMMKKLGSSYKEVKVEKDGDYGPRCIFGICSMNEILSVVSSLVDF